MRRPLLALGLAGALLAFAAADAGAASKRIHPTNDAEKITLRIGRGNSTYHVATAEKPFEFKIKGPTPIRVLSRLLFGGGTPADPTRYRVRLEIDGVELRTVGETTGPAGDSDFGGDPVGDLCKRVLTIPAGTHKVRVYPIERDLRIAVRLFRGDGRTRKPVWVSYAPETYERAIRLHARDSEYTYYRFSTGTPVTLSVHGPLRLRIMTRLDFGVERGYYQNYAIKCFLDGELIRTHNLRARPSHTSNYPDLPEITPGTGETVEMEVPKGLHRIEIGLDCTTGETASMRIMIPKRAVTNGR
ncbi:MAG: hypothetical protein ABIK65_16290 [Candidatus Eisenbacteria bacterium]